MDSQTHVTGRKSRSFRPLHSFSLRTLFVAMLLAGPLLGWWLQQRYPRYPRTVGEWMEVKREQERLEQQRMR
jgi:hypothetical protein